MSTQKYKVFLVLGLVHLNSKSGANFVSFLLSCVILRHPASHRHVGNVREFNPVHLSRRHVDVNSTLQHRRRYYFPGCRVHYLFALSTRMTSELTRWASYIGHVSYVDIHYSDVHAFYDMKSFKLFLYAERKA